MSIETNISDNLPFYAKQEYVNDVKNLKNTYQEKSPFNQETMSTLNKKTIDSSDSSVSSEQWSSMYDNLPEHLRESVFNILSLFVQKNNQYKTGHWASAFLQNQIVLNKHLNPISYAMSLVSKQDKAALDLIFSEKDEHDYNRKGGEKMLIERLSDGVVYRLIMLGLINEFGETIFS